MRTRLWLTLLLTYLGGFAAFGQAGLDATVYPGYTFSTGERLTTEKLNLLGRPTIYVSGTIGGTNVGLAAESVTWLQLDSSLPTNSIGWLTNGGVRFLDVVDGGISYSELSTNAVGGVLYGGLNNPLNLRFSTDGLTSGTTDTLALNYNTNGLTVSGGKLMLNFNTNGLTTGTSGILALDYDTNLLVVTGGKLSINTNGTELGPFDLPNGSASMVTNVVHSLGKMPRIVRWVLIAPGGDRSYPTNAEVSITSFLNSGGIYVPAYSYGATSTNVWLIQRYQPYVEEYTAPYTINAIMRSTWKAKVYLEP